MPRLLFPLLTLFTLWILALPAQAGYFDDTLDQDGFLPVERAFQASAWRDDDTLYVGFRNAPGHYLYRQRFAVVSDAPGVTLGELQLPPGTAKTDEYLGQAQVFYDPVVMRAAIHGEPDGPLPVRVSFQGCADAGLCYPPEQWSLNALPGSPPAAFAETVRSSISASSPGDAASVATSEQRQDPAPAPSEDSRFQALLTEASLPVVLGLFFVAGLGLTFTPCVLPMLPILAALVVGRRPGKARGLALSTSYVGGMAASYAAVGVLMGLFGAGLNLQARLQSPWVLVPFALAFVLFALVLFDLLTLRMPASLSGRIDAWQQRLQRSGPLGLALAGALSVVVVSPCVSAPLAGALVFISASGNALFGGLALLALALGMGVPLLLVGTFGSSLLPRAGHWLQSVKSAFGVLLLGVAIWLIERLLPGPPALLLWAALTLGSALALGAFERGTRPGWPRLRQTAALMLLAWGLALVLGAAQGGSDPLRPLALGDAATDPSTAEFTRVASLEELAAQLEIAAQRDRPAFVDVSAAWCVTCQIMERDVFPDPAVASRLADYHRIRADVTAGDAQSRRLLDHFGLFGPPGLLFFDAGGREVESARIQGEIGAEALASRLDRLAAKSRSSAGGSG
ncbi:protein-disulfide reductase DsbD [Halomonas sp. HP20-15]|uniref:protein-disulfide reductase DsbD n=1 Tax=Halomonas sp. HP20-15 TaxID=3085901 RepID=UPI00298115E6|nr:protein-disulfide reductase DsbD [Halomonas sp. HP20-15]MDW5376626.1 protein-disulfide reductase DsbD [Halomonas sp. HP20-15]